MYVRLAKRSYEGQDIMKLILSIILASITVFLFIAGLGCGRRTDDQEQVTICFAFQDLETEFWVAAHSR